MTSARLMPTEARGNYLPEAPYLHKTKTYLNYNRMRVSRHSTVAQPATQVDTTCWQLFISIRPIFIFCCRSYVKLLDYWRAEKNFLYFRRPPEARGICHICHMVNPALDMTYTLTELIELISVCADAKYTVFKKRPPFYFWITRSKINYFNDFWYVKSWENLTWKS